MIEKQRKEKTNESKRNINKIMMLRNKGTSN